MTTYPLENYHRRRAARLCMTYATALLSLTLQARSESLSPFPPTCGPKDRPETAQGQTTLAERFQPGPAQAFNCNLELMGQYEGEGASADVEIFGKCAYFSTAGLTPNPDMKHPGVAVLDVSDSRHPKATTYLNSPAMLGAQESLEVNATHRLMIASTLPDIFDVYDLSNDCAHPVLIGSRAIPGLASHDGEFAPDGQTFYGAKWPPSPQSPPHSAVFALDVSDPNNLHEISRWVAPMNWSTHGAAVNMNGTRVYVAVKRMSPHRDPVSAPNGLAILDATEIQARKPRAQFRLISQLFWTDSLGAEGMQYFKIGRDEYLAFSDNLGAIGYSSPPPPNACDSGQPGHGFARIIDVNDERNPRTVSRLILASADPSNCSRVMHDPTLYGGYGSFACTVDDQNDARMLACGNFEAGLRVFDIREPARRQELAYYKPPARRTERRPGSIFGALAANPQTETAPDHTADSVVVAPRFQENGREIWFVSVDNGFQVVRFSDRFIARHRDLFSR